MLIILWLQLSLGLATLPRAIGVQVLLKTDLATAHEQLFETIGLFQPVKGGLMLHAQVDDLRWFARQLARLDCAFDIVAPAKLRAELANVEQAQERMKAANKAIRTHKTEEARIAALEAQLAAQGL